MSLLSLSEASIQPRTSLLKLEGSPEGLGASFDGLLQYCNCFEDEDEDLGNEDVTTCDVFLADDESGPVKQTSPNVLITKCGNVKES